MHLLTTSFLCLINSSKQLPALESISRFLEINKGLSVSILLLLFFILICWIWKPGCSTIYSSYRLSNSLFWQLRAKPNIRKTYEKREKLVVAVMAVLSARHVQFWWSRGPHKYLTLFNIPVKLHRFCSKISTSWGGVLILGFPLHSKGMVGF